MDAESTVESDTFDADLNADTLNNPLSHFALTFHRWMHTLRQCYLSILLLCISLQSFFIEMKLNWYTATPWPLVFFPLWVATTINTVATTYTLRRSSIFSTARKSYIIEHVNHMIFWFALSFVSFFICLKLSYVLQWGATAICSPLFVALVIQSLLYPLKNKKRVHGCKIPEGFPTDPVYVTSLFVALRIDEVIMWDWNWIFWCPWVIWIVALIDGIFYTFYFAFVLNRYIYHTEAADSWGGTVIDGLQYFYNPLWHTVRIGALWAMATTLVVTLFCMLSAASQRMNGDVTITSISITLPLGIMMLWSGVTSLCMTYVIKPRLLRREPAKCGICKKQIRQILRIELSKAPTNVRSGRTVKVIDYGEEDSRVQRVASNVLGVLNTPRTTAPQQLWNPPGKAFFLPTNNVDDTTDMGTENSSVEEENQRLLPSRGDKHEYHEMQYGRNTVLGNSIVEDEERANGNSSEKHINDHFKGFCPICMENVPIDCVFLDCGHNIYCWDCGVDVFECRVEK